MLGFMAVDLWLDCVIIQHACWPCIVLRKTRLFEVFRFTTMTLCVLAYLLRGSYLSLLELLYETFTAITTARV